MGTEGDDVTDDELAVVEQVRERTLLREYDRATAMAERLRAQLALVEKVRHDLVAQMRKVVEPADDEGGD